MSQHIPGILSSNGHGSNSSLRIFFYTPFICFSFCIKNRIITFVYFLFKRILRKIIICTAYISIFEVVLCGIDGTAIIFHKILFIFNYFYSQFFLEILKLFFFITNYDYDFFDSCFLQLTNLSFDQNFSSYTNQRFWFFIRNRSKSTGKTSSHNHCIFHSI